MQWYMGIRNKDYNIFSYIYTRRLHNMESEIIIVTNTVLPLYDNQICLSSWRYTLGDITFQTLVTQ